jgi:uncharacterized protein HemY
MYLEAARGWLELGDPKSALQEIENITGLRRAQPDVLRLRLQIYLKCRQWRSAFAIAQGLAGFTPRDPDVFLAQAEAARQMPGGSLSRALALLLEVANEFPDEPAVPFRLACYNCQLGNHATALSWLQIAFDVASRSKTELKWLGTALEEPDLAPLHRVLTPERQRVS